MKKSVSHVADLTPALQSRYPAFLRSEIKRVLLAQHDGKCFLEIVSLQPTGPATYAESKERQDLGFIRAKRKPLFKPSRSAARNATLFIEKMDPISIANCTPIFSEAACVLITGQACPSSSD